MATMVWGITMFGYILGGLASILTNSDAMRARYKHRLTTIKEYLVRGTAALYILSTPFILISRMCTLGGGMW